ncbi:MAG: tRNA preQ1(34) S-adenosylmethionine ribosyltransferase-isomerase QueA [Candidatus Lloydbacteria bacterium RIFCSPHIGHO2_02_FULL_54_17]|uniref:S-adenosylmethionine:tRNA ribosyltransferase-isomerase n=1 Tax=Candidatus Lloydbacteria bacterium RIFCSPHIGHO2_02_FULL_54_17 TaxID=1798664 RepID=A0A1G2DEU2_9BACT|nr:MAG: tRNA preQ1(34) S-adenosylmethionine ribosyltransferase-isomerase QueA [Candidatus Lloydbacteria bacterium RIFCSPHIGHO2_01_FULL_54_11]OGZ12164.1 MAG: tRNA preQ1(34) S-adenosylmethionine ribosyltransferase-isomerase QueA [Candidatus Lloydbacteria bacterium RIFCSPHIGHO2_02_FULL_54_17]OGZ12955.1 MAG: tRNA preQ1(34) S-adenosylmethionine ribosyltransferase-isomerase QueA [Candidatus Lloydbacteria bacterium RIFCSPLOWO2_01_FULL_54_18]OGZ15952.1 MAG: tRNA preQ1(34) S-adenosylmethionine ribosyltra
MRLADYNYHLPKELIANSPASPRDSARLFVYNTATDTIQFDTFKNIGKYLPRPALLVMNDTKVVPARLLLTKETGGKIKILLMMNEFRNGDTLIKGIVDRKLILGTTLFFKNGSQLEVVKQGGQFFFFKPSVSGTTLWKLLDEEGRTPIPPYIKNTKLSERALRERYQSVFAQERASVAAPTASLHFTEKLISRLKNDGVDHTEVTLHVGLGTFAPIDAKNIAEKKLFTEYYEVDEKSAGRIVQAKASGVPVIPVGTTALRALESAAVTSDQGVTSVVAGARKTNLFIYPPYDFKVADGLITNFHVPKSSLMLLVDAFLQHKKARRRTLELYDVAIKEKFRFYSFGDGMLII